MKIKDLEEGTPLSSVIVKSPCGKIGYWHSQWNRGVWLKGHSNRIHPVFVGILSEAAEWEVIDDEKLINLE